MTEIVQKKCELLVENRQHVSKVSFLDNGLMKDITAQAYTDKNRVVDEKQFKACIQLLKKKKGIFSGSKH